MVVGARVEVRGIPELKRAFDGLEHDLPGEFRDHLGDPVGSIIGATRQAMPRDTGEAAGGIQPVEIQGGVGIGFGSVAHQPWLDFGGDIGRGVQRPFVRGGRYLYPTIAAHERELVDATGDAVLDAARSNGFEVRE